MLGFTDLYQPMGVAVDPDGATVTELPATAVGVAVDASGNVYLSGGVAKGSTHVVKLAAEWD